MAEHGPLPDSINPNYFPAKLWSLVNDPANEAVQWDSSGRLVIINQQLLESQVLAPGAAGAHGFKTTNFSSFVRQLNLYGFKKVDAVNQDRLESLSCRYFCNENFQRNRPELVASLRRFTVGNKTRLQAGLDLNTRFPSRSEVQGGGQQVTKESLSLLRSAQELLTSSHLSSPNPAPRPHSGTPMPPKSMKRVHFGAVSSPDDAAGPFKTSYTGVPSPGKHPYHHQGFLTPAKHAGSRFYQHGYYRPVCHSSHSNLTTSQIPGLQTGFIPPKNYYQAGFLVNKSSNKGLQEKENQDKKICDVNLDKVFEVADEVMQSFSSSRLVPVKTSVVAAPSSTSCGAAQHKNTQTAVYAASAPSSSVVFKQEEASAPSARQQGPENEGFVQTPADPAPEEETINVEVWDS